MHPNLSFWGQRQHSHLGTYGACFAALLIS